MRKFAVAIALTALAAFPALAAVTDNYHYNTSMQCADCHSMHASAHQITDGAGITAAGGSTSRSPMWSDGTARPYLLKGNNVCESCHDAQTFAPDVVEGNSNGYLRSAGGVLDAADDTKGGHVMGSSVRPPGYSGAGVGGYFGAGSVLECVSCHSPHGGAAFRNLGPYAMRGALGSANIGFVTPTVSKTGTFVTTADVNNLAAPAHTFGTDAGNFNGYYSRSNIVYTNAGAITYNGTTSTNRMDQFCGVCHGAFHGGAVTDATTVGDGTHFVRHPTSTVLITALPTSTVNGYNTKAAAAFANLKVYQAGATAAAATDSPGCLTCHKAHGNNNPFALIYPGTSGTDTTEEGGAGSTYKTLCKTCHSMGGVL